MSRLIILLGFDGLGPAATPRCVYVGRDAAEAEAARAACSDACTLMVRNPTGVRKVAPAVAERMNHELLASREGANLVAAAPLAAQKPVEEVSVPLPDGQAGAQSPEFQGAPPQGAEGLDPQGSTELTHDVAAVGEGDLPDGPADETSDVESAPASRGSMSPRRKK